MTTEPTEWGLLEQQLQMIMAQSEEYAAHRAAVTAAEQEAVRTRALAESRNDAGPLACKDCGRLFEPAETAWWHIDPDRYPGWLCQDCHDVERARTDERYDTIRTELDEYVEAVRWRLLRSLDWEEVPTPCEGGCGRLLAFHWTVLPEHPACSPECRRIARSRRRAAQTRPDTTCETCGQEIRASRADTRYCSPAHRQKAYRLRIREIARDRQEADE